MPTHSNNPSPDALLERIHLITPLISDNAALAESQRKPVDEVIEALKKTGVFRAFVPRVYGGYEIDTDTFIDVGIAVSEACASTGWVTTFYMEHNWLLAQFGQEVQEEIFGNQPYILAPASINPIGEAEAVDGGFRVSGRWQWGTGIMHADWVILNGIVGKDSSMPYPLLFIVPASEVQVEDTWHSSGMCGTGSNDIVAESLFVPSHRSQELVSLAIGRSPGAELNGSPIYRVPMLIFLALTAAIPALGAARRAVNEFKNRLSQRVMFGTQQKQGELSAAQIRLGHAQVKVDSAERLLRGVGHDLTRWGKEEDICPIEERARLKLQIAHSVEMCRDVVSHLLHAAGAGAHLSSHPLQRIGRDVSMLSSHIAFDLDIGAETYGRTLIGLEPNSLI